MLLFALNFEKKTPKKRTHEIFKKSIKDICGYRLYFSK